MISWTQTAMCFLLDPRIQHKDVLLQPLFDATKDSNKIIRVYKCVNGSLAATLPSQTERGQGLGTWDPECGFTPYRL